MGSISTFILNIFIFLSVYVQVFFFLTFVENRKKIVTRKGGILLKEYPAVTITVPVFNEEKTVEKTVESLMDLNYPKDKLQLFLVDDGSTDNTWQVLQKFKDYSNIKIFHKENGGKFTVLNFALSQTTTPFFGCLDADSFADRESLVRLMSTFEKDSSIMAVVPSVTVCNSKNFIQSAQVAEYYMGVYFKKMLGFLKAIDVTPGPLTVFKKEVFDNIGGYRHGHNTEDMEIAYRMQTHNYKIEHCHDAYVYTNTPGTIKKLYKQRLRWIFGFLNNTIDYRSVLFKKKYGNFSIFTLPTRVVSIVAVVYLFGRIVYNFSNFLYLKILQIQTIGFHLHFNKFTFDPFFFNIQNLFFLFILTYILILFSMLFGRKMAEGSWALFPGMLFFFPVFSIIAPFWLFNAMYNTIRRRRPDWR